MAGHVRREAESSMTPAHNVSQARIYGYCAILVVIWASAFTLVGVAVPHIAPIWLVTFRIMLGACALTVYIKLIGERFPPITDSRWIWYTVLGFTGMLLPFTLAAQGQLSVDSGLAAILVGVMPLITIVLAHFFTEERLTPTKFIGFGIGFFGIVILFLPDNFSLTLIANWKAQLLILAAASSYAITTVAAKRAPKTPSIIGGAMMLVGIAPVTLIIALMSGIPAHTPPPIAIGAAIGLALFSTALANILYLRVIELSGPSLLAKVNYFIAPVSIVLGIIFLNEEFSWRMVTAFSIILIGMIIARRAR